jgi:hypothetical protein
MFSSLVTTCGASIVFHVCASSAIEAIRSISDDAPSDHRHIGDDMNQGYCSMLGAVEAGPLLSPRLISTDHHASGRNARTHSPMG